GDEVGASPSRAGAQGEFVGGGRPDRTFEMTVQIGQGSRDVHGQGTSLVGEADSDTRRARDARTWSAPKVHAIAVVAEDREHAVGGGDANSTHAPDAKRRDHHRSTIGTRSSHPRLPSSPTNRRYDA